MKTNDSATNILVTCPQCTHTHTLRVNEADLPNDDRERYYKLHEIEKMLSVSRKTLKRWIYTDLLVAEKFGSQGGGAPWYVSESALRAFRQKHNR